MTGHVDPTARWADIFHGSGMYVPMHTRPQWGRIDDAIRTADRAWKNQATMNPTRHTPPAARGDADWCQIAADTYDRLTASGAYWHLDNDITPCAADERLIRAWLDAPWVPPADEPKTMAQAQGLDGEFATDRDIDPGSLHMLVDLAQHAGVFGGSRHHVALLRWVENGASREDAFLVAVRPIDGHSTGSPQIGIDELVHDRANPVTTIVGILQGVAQVVNSVIAATQPSSSQVTHERVSEHNSTSVDEDRTAVEPVHTSSAFPLLRVVASAVGVTSDPPTSPAPAASNARNR